MFAAMRRFFVAGLAMWSCLVTGCSRKPEKPTREDCDQAAEHIAGLIIDDHLAHADTWFDEVTAEPGDTGIPAVIDRTVFAQWLSSPPGRTWLLQRRGNTLTGVQAAIDHCIENGTKMQVKCLVAATSKSDVDACDNKYAQGPKTPPASADGGATNGSANDAGASGSGSAEIK